jgi:hypothetical protein
MQVTCATTHTYTICQSRSDHLQEWSICRPCVQQWPLLTSHDARIEARECMVKQLLAKIIEQRLLGAITWLILWSCGPITLVESKRYCFALRSSTRRRSGLRGARLWRVEERSVALHPNERFRAAPQFFHQRVSTVRDMQKLQRLYRES